MHAFASHTRWTYSTRISCARTDRPFGHLDGQATCTLDDANALTITESGIWRASGPGLPALGTRTTNVWRAAPLKVSGGGWRIEHLRLSEPVHLLDLAPASPGHWASVAPHPCGEDTYELEADTTDPDGATLVWTVRGPEKAHVLTTRYTPA